MGCVSGKPSGKAAVAVAPAPAKIPADQLGTGFVLKLQTNTITTLTLTNLESKKTREQLEEAGLLMDDKKHINMPVLCAALVCNSSLQELYLNMCQLTDTDIPPLCVALSSHPQLTKLSLIGNKFSSGSGSSLGGLCSSSKSKLDYLDLQQNALGDVGLHAFFKELAGTAKRPKNAHTLTVLNVNDTSMQQAEQYLPAVLATNTVLETLFMTDNPLSVETAPACLKAMESNTTLMELRLFRCGDAMLDEDRIKLLRRVRKNKPAEEEEDSNVIAAVPPATAGKNLDPDLPEKSTTEGVA